MKNFCRGSAPGPPASNVNEKGWPRRATPTKYTLCFLFLLLSLAACKSPGDPATSNNNSAETVVSATPPFQTKEPERYQATRIITISTPDGKTTVSKTAIARDGDLRRHESETASKQVAWLDLPEGRFVVSIHDKVFADLATETSVTLTDEAEITPERFLHTETGTTSYQKLGSEVVGGRNSNKYRVVVNSSSGGNVSTSETLIWIDEKLNMPVRSETKSPDGTHIKTELADIVLDVDKRIFQLPEGYEKIAFSEFRKRLAGPNETKDSQPRR